MSAHRTRLTVLAGLSLAALAGRADAQHSVLERVSVSARIGELRPAGHSQLFDLLDAALTPGANALRPRLAGGALHVAVTSRLGIVLGADAGERTVASTSRVQATGAASDARQQTTLTLRALPYAGAEWQALRWRGAAVTLGAGGGVASYALQQQGDFVDAQRRVGFQNAFRSEGCGAFGYGSAGVLVPLRRWVALQGDVRRQVGSAPMSGDFAGFDRLDVGGTTWSAGLRVRPWGVRR
jgi:hypothetical protein